MAKQRIIEVPYKTCEMVLLAIVRDEDDGEDYVEVCAWHQDQEGDDYYQRQTSHFQSIRECERFIEDFSENSACQFVESFNF